MVAVVWVKEVEEVRARAREEAVSLEVAVASVKVAERAARTAVAMAGAEAANMEGWVVEVMVVVPLVVAAVMEVVAMAAEVVMMAGAARVKVVAMVRWVVALVEATAAEAHRRVAQSTHMGSPNHYRRHSNSSC